MNLSLFPNQRALAVAWFERRSARERLLVGFGLALATVFLFITLIWRPLSLAQAAALARIHADETVIATLRAAGPQLAQRGPVPAGSPAAFVTDTAAEAGLTIRRLEPDGGRIRVGLDDADFDKTLRWLERLERERGLRITELKLDRRPAPGVVNAQVTLMSR